MRSRVVAMFAVLWMVSAAVAGGAEAGESGCALALAKATGQYGKRRLVVAAHCSARSGEGCDSAAIDSRLAGLQAKLAARLAEACTDADLAALAPDGICPDPSGQCTLPVTDLASALACVTCMAASGADALDRVIGRHHGRSGDLCGGCPGEDCGPDGFCEYAPGTCSRPLSAGACVPWDPDAVCEPEEAPVCGCDGVTYPNNCERRRARTSKAHDGSCEDTPASCSADTACPDGQVCEQRPGRCDDPPEDGKCVARPESCPVIYAPVCGCDGITYANDCERLIAGVAKDHPGECTDLPLCGGSSHKQCEEGQFCDLLPGLCRVEDRPGRCSAVPDQCPPDEDAPVCGCDGVTYTSDCLRQMAGVSVAHPGKCQERCAGPDQVACAEGETCLLPPGNCDTADDAGVCVATPQGCPDLYMPVCGCDGTTYANKCELLQAGIGLDHPGPCDQEDHHHHGMP